MSENAEKTRKFKLWGSAVVMIVISAAAMKYSVLVPVAVVGAIIWALHLVKYQHYRFKDEILDLMKQQQNKDDSNFKQLSDKIENLERLQGKTVKNMPWDMSDEV